LPVSFPLALQLDSDRFQLAYKLLDSSFRIDQLDIDIIFCFNFFLGFEEFALKEDGPFGLLYQMLPHIVILFSHLIPLLCHLFPLPCDVVPLFDQLLPPVFHFIVLLIFFF
jgi:hypothetical protein